MKFYIRLSIQSVDNQCSLPCKLSFGWKCLPEYLKLLSIDNNRPSFLNACYFEQPSNFKHSTKKIATDLSIQVCEAISRQRSRRSFRLLPIISFLVQMHDKVAKRFCVDEALAMKRPYFYELDQD